jgi:hypothetical protein
MGKALIEGAGGIMKTLKPLPPAAVPVRPSLLSSLWSAGPAGLAKGKAAVQRGERMASKARELAQTRSTGGTILELPLPPAPAGQPPSLIESLWDAGKAGLAKGKEAVQIGERMASNAQFLAKIREGSTKYIMPRIIIKPRGIGEQPSLIESLWSAGPAGLAKGQEAVREGNSIADRAKHVAKFRAEFGIE